ncbi:FMN-linked oxidoreductase [Mycena sanguinolenta]|uniref:FMN-linked oxidoreductase n=1 Tax=Mycena sanguinolenta TaxID=230812 RepID=A0A8H7CIS6_9AGAR|nr:FMN-linked oxidoreductase [Mycena sanguinolenta]
MVRSGALPTRLFALKHGATLVWGPEMVDKAMLHAERVVDPVTGKPLDLPDWLRGPGARGAGRTHRHERRIGHRPQLRLPRKPFSTHSGMGAALLPNPDLLCSILTALRRDPTRDHRVRENTPPADAGGHAQARRAHREHGQIVDFVRGWAKGIAVIENGDCTGAEDAKRIHDLTGAHSVMIARAAEANPSCFSPTPLADVERTLCPAYLRVAKYLDNNWGSQNSASRSSRGNTLMSRKPIRSTTARFCTAPRALMGWRILSHAAIARNEPPPAMAADEESEPPTPPVLVTPSDTTNPCPPGSGAPLMLALHRLDLPILTGRDPLTPSPSVHIDPV